MPGQRIRNPQMPRRIRRFIDRPAGQDHRGILIENRNRFPRIALELPHIEHGIVVEIEPPGCQKPQQRPRRQRIGLKRLQQRIRRRIAGDRSMPVALDGIGPPLQPDFARPGLRYPLPDRRDLG